MCRVLCWGLLLLPVPESARGGEVGGRQAVPLALRVGSVPPSSRQVMPSPLGGAATSLGSLTGNEESPRGPT